MMTIISLLSLFLLFNPLPTTTIGSFVAPQANSFFITSENIYMVARVFDENKDRIIDYRGEVEMAPSILRICDTDSDRQLKLFEFTDALDDNKIAIYGFNEGQATKIAKAIFGRNPVYANSLGTLGKVMDTSLDGFVSKKEFSEALVAGNLAISGSYIIGLNDYGATK